MSLVTKIASDLNDTQHITWTADQIAGWIEEAIGLAFDIRPDLFLSTRVIQVKPGTEIQDVDADFISSVQGQCTKDGRVIKRLRQRMTDTIWTGSVGCTSTGLGEIESYYIADGSTIHITPPVRGDVVTYLSIRCVKLDDAVESKSVSKELEPIIIQYVLYRALAVDNESTAAIAMSTDHFAKMKDLIGIVRSSEQLRYNREMAFKNPKAIRGASQ